MFAYLYDGIQYLGVLVLLPKLLWKAIFYKDKTLLCYLGFFIPKAKPSKGLCFLLYGVSVGEIKAFSSLFAKLKENEPSASFFVSSRTRTGLEEAKRSLTGASGYFLLPFDFSWAVNKLFRRIKPDVVLISEGDLWYNFLQEARRRDSLLCLISGKISSRSFKRFSWFPFFSKKLFGLFTLICAQNELFAKRFNALGAPRVVVTGNIKLANQIELLSEADCVSLKDALGIKHEDFVIVIGSTHHPEEAKLLEVLFPLLKKFPFLKCLFVPRHPSRFPQVREILYSSEVPSISYSDLNQKTGHEQLFCIDKMGGLLSLYQIADLAIVGGSFESSLKGHNILEPIFAHVPLIFGPYMSDQKELVRQVLLHQAGLQVDLKELRALIENLIGNPSSLNALKEQEKEFSAQIADVLEKTWVPLYDCIRFCKKNA